MSKIQLQNVQAKVLEFVFVHVWLKYFGNGCNLLYLCTCELVNFWLLSDLSSKKRKQLIENETWLFNFLLSELSWLVQACTSVKKFFVLRIWDYIDAAHEVHVWNIGLQTHSKLSIVVMDYFLFSMFQARDHYLPKPSLHLHIWAPRLLFTITFPAPYEPGSFHIALVYLRTFPTIVCPLSSML
jgi:hypothetical protein